MVNEGPSNREFLCSEVSLFAIKSIFHVVCVSCCKIQPHIVF